MNQSQIPKSTKRASTFTGPTTIVPSSESNKGNEILIINKLFLILKIYI